MSFIPHTDEDTEKMLAAIGIKDIMNLFDEIPKGLPRARLKNIPKGMNEIRLMQHAKDLTKTVPHLKCFLGAGAYDHHIPAAIWDICSRGELLTSYTPYQSEASQGSLQIIYEFQSMISTLFAMEVSNASVYDGATALAEAILMAKRLDKGWHGNTVLIAKGLHPHYRQVLTSLLKHQHIIIKELPFDKEAGHTDMNNLQTTSFKDVFAVVISQCNFFGVIEPFDKLNIWAKTQGIFSIAQVHPMSLGVLKAPGEWAGDGADIAVGEGQALGIPLASGGPYLGLMACKKAYVRQLPGRIVGRTIDTQGRPGFALTLQAREQHIRRGKATSNICSNQGINLVAATIFMSLMGPQGLARVGKICYQNTHLLTQKISAIPGVSPAFGGIYFHESVVKLPVDVHQFCQLMTSHGLLPGLIIQSTFPELKNCLLICATEKINHEDITHYLDVATEAISSLGQEK